MVKNIIISLVLLSSLSAENIYDKNCMPCHKNLPISLGKMYMSYLEAYSGETNVKTVLKYYLNNPTKNLSLMSELYINTYGIKKQTTLNEQELNEAVDIYWEKFKVFDKLK